MYLAGVSFSEFDATTTILEVLRSDDETDINDTDTKSGGEAANSASSDTVDHLTIIML